MMNPIPLYKPVLDHEEIEVASQVLKSGVLSRGKETESFEKEFSRYVNKQYAVAVSNGTTALHLAIKSLNWSKGDEVITTPFSFIASSNALLYENIKPVFVDIDPLTLNMDPEKIEKKISKKTKGILLVHIFGLPAYHPLYHKLKSKYNLDIIEDACEAIGKPGIDFPVGKLGKVTVYSFFANKPMTSGGEGGMLVTDSLRLYNYFRSLRDQGRSNHLSWLQHVKLGYNYRMTEIQAAIGRIQLKKINMILKERKKIAFTYRKLLEGIDSVRTGFIDSPYTRSWFIFYVQFATKKIRDKIKLQMHKNHIESHIYFPSINLFPSYRQLGYKKGDSPISEKISDTTLALPFYLGLSYTKIKKITDVIKNSL